MRTKAKGFIVAGILAMSIPFMFAMKGKQKKICINHKGTNICIAEPAAEAHLREHCEDYIVGPCD